MGLRAKGWGSTMPRATLRHMRRAWVTEGIVVVVWLKCWLVWSVGMGVLVSLGWAQIENALVV